MLQVIDSFDGKKVSTVTMTAGPIVPDCAIRAHALKYLGKSPSDFVDFEVNRGFGIADIYLYKTHNI